MSFLKSVGTALPGVAFQMALQYMAPDLNEIVGRYSDLIRGYTNRYTDACTAAQSIMEDTGANGALQKAVFGAKNALRASGAASDQSEADRQVRDDGEKAIDKAPVQKDASGNVVSAPEINLTWALINSGNFSKGNSQELKEVDDDARGHDDPEKVGLGQGRRLDEHPLCGSGFAADSLRRSARRRQDRTAALRPNPSAV